MKRAGKRLSFIIFTLILSVSMLAGCGPKKPTPEDAQAYVKAVMDVMCLGDYDHSVNLADIEEGTEGQVREQIIEAGLASFGAEQGVSDEVRADFKETMLNAFTLAKYTVGDAVATDDGGYDVTVTIEPLRMYEGFNDNFESVLTEKVEANIDAVRNMSEEEQFNFVMGVIIEMLNENLKDPKYDDPVDVTVHYGLIDEEQNLYGCSSDEGTKLGEKLFSLDGIE